VTKTQKLAIWAALVIVAGALAGVIRIRRSNSQEIRVLMGSVLTEDKDTNKQVPIPNAEITFEGGPAESSAKSDASGFFVVQLRPGIPRGRSITLQFRHMGYQPLDFRTPALDQLYIARMKPIPREARAKAETPQMSVAHIRVRYTVPSNDIVNIGSAVKTFQAVNTGNVPCDPRGPCSPDGKWKATIATASLEAGDDNEFQGVRVSCIAGPCAFTKIEIDRFSTGGRNISVSVRNWSDTASFLMEGEVVHNTVNDMVRVAYPVIFAQAMDFTLPATAKGPSIEAEINGADIVYPLGPTLTLTWAKCSMNVVSGGAKLYRCEITPGYRFQ
jgi:hypothetical protein